MADTPLRQSPDAVTGDGYAPADQADVGATPILWPLEVVGLRRRTRPKRVGAKATVLARLVREGFPVPRGWVLDTRHFSRLVGETLPGGYDVSTLIKLSDSKERADRAARSRELILRTPLADEVRAALDALWTSVQAEAAWGLAVRSSATSEEVEETSLAGLAVTVLGVRGAAALEDAVREVWASAVLPRTLAYLAHAGVRDMAMGVVIEVMVRAESAGVLFTAPPPGLECADWSAEERLVSATLGLGAPVIEGAAVADFVRLAPGGAVVDALVASKTRAMVIGRAGPELAEVPDHLARAPALSSETLRELSRLADRLDQPRVREALGFEREPLDVAFAVEPGPGEQRKVFLLQARSVRGRGFPEGGNAETVWSRTNLGEALPGAATPLTWSVARAFSESGFREGFAALGCRVPREATLVANVHGRFYLNLSALARIVGQIPGMSPRALVYASGGASPATIDHLERQAAEVSARGFVLRLPFKAPSIIAAQQRLASEVDTYEADAAQARRSLLDMDLTLLPDDALTTTLKAARVLLDRTGALTMRCASVALASHLALSKVLARIAAKRASARIDGDDDTGPLGLSSSDSSADALATEHLAQSLVGGVHDLDSAAPGLALLRVAHVARGDADARTRLLRGGVRSPNDLAPGPTRRQLEAFLEKFGDRAVREAELATPRWREEPEGLIAMLVANLRAPPTDPDKALARARALADRELAQLEGRLPSVQLYLLRTLITRAQHFSRLRERMRGWVTRVLGMVRVIALDVDRRLRRIDPSLPEGSVFLCTYGELRAALSSGRAEVGHVVRLRRAEHARDAARPDPPPTFIGRPPPILLPPLAGSVLTGLPASGGVVEGRARILAPGTMRLDELQAGEILVCRIADVALSPLFLVAAALVTELGGPLSHAAVVARAYGTVAVTNVAGATMAIRTGQRLRVDGDRGVVERLDDGP